MWQFHDYGHRKRDALFDGGGGYGAALTRTRYASLLCGPWTPASLKPTRSLNADDNTGQPTVVDAALAELLKDGCAWHFLM
ncbi:unnamed protein product [Sphagnum jensenii]|uniref:Uncharacterized protein n=1 Tax=Sphagnum jensenii TaxID=128206 RepID=A0ABP1A3X1_9BRYO